MRQNNLIRPLWLVFLLTSLFPAFGQNRFILRAPDALVPGIIVRHNLGMVCTPNQEGVSCVLNSDTRTPDQVVSELSSDPDVQHAEQDSHVSVPEGSRTFNANQQSTTAASAAAANTAVTYFGTPAWNSYVNQTAAALTHLPAVQQYLVTGKGIVAVIDTGVDPQQPVLQGSLVPGYDFVNGVAGIPSEWNDLDPATAAILNRATAGDTVIQLNQSTAAILDQSTAAILDITHVPAAFGHGTMIAGIIHLAAPTAMIMPLKAFRGDGTANLSDIVQAVYFAVDNGAQVINMSFSLTSNSLELMKALNYATAHNVICVGAVGNDGIETIVYPAAFHNVIGVASTDSQDSRSTFSNYGEALAHLAAPGEGIITTYPGGNYAMVSGTSFSAPFVAAAAALLIQVDLDMNPTEALQALSNAKKLTPELGFGRLDLFQAVRPYISH
ncbi:MAG TPA: S8 family serine peptidase [Acidobacteriota bacterium]|nr:S8 family serine peptidase [Acidobacteriota bacterium]